MDELPQFRGDESPEDAEKWIKRLVSSTGTFSDSGIFRHLFNQLVDGSPAMEWYENLDEDLKSSWTRFQRQFRDRWVQAPRLPDRRVEEWEVFRSHALTHDIVFVNGGLDPRTEPITIDIWAEDHLRMGKETEREDSELIETTELLVPIFIQAYLHVYAKSASTFEDYCLAIRDIPSQIVELERFRAQRSSEDWRREVSEVSQRVNLLLSRWDEGNSGGAPPQVELEHSPTTKYRSSNMSVGWEPGSPHTSVVSMKFTTNGGFAEVGTLISQLIPLLNSWNRPQNELTNVTIEDGLAPEIPQESDTSLVPSEWRKPTLSTAKTYLIDLSQQAISFMQMDSNTPSERNIRAMASAVVVFDIVTGQRNDIACELQTDWTGRLWFELLNVYRYRAHQDSSTLNQARAGWRRYAEEDTGTASSVVKPTQKSFTRGGIHWNLDLRPSGEPTAAGGIFVVYNPNENPFISPVNTVLFLVVSSYLAECTCGAKYQNLAILGAGYVKTHMLDLTTSLIKDCSIDATTGGEKPGAVPSSYLTGLVIEAFSVLADATKDDSWRDKAIEIATAAIHYKEWHSADGILTVGSDEVASEETDVKLFKGLLNRGLMFAYQRNPDNKPFRDLVRSYINVQFNALYDLSRSGNSFGVDWRGPYSGPYRHAQLAALDTVVAAIAVNE